jgi:hypothetical protein
MLLVSPHHGSAGAERDTEESRYLKPQYMADEPFVRDKWA